MKKQYHRHSPEKTSVLIQEIVTVHGQTLSGPHWIHSAAAYYFHMIQHHQILHDFQRKDLLVDLHLAATQLQETHDLLYLQIPSHVMLLLSDNVQITGYCSQSIKKYKANN